MVELAKVQDEIVGDGAATVVIITGEVPVKARDLLDHGIHRNVVMSSY